MSDETRTPRKYAVEVPYDVANSDTIQFVAPKRVSGGGRQRSDYQRQLDEQILDGYGKPYMGLYVPNTDEAIVDMKKRIRNSGTYLNLGIRFGDNQPTNDPEVTIIVFKVTDQIKRPRKTSEQ